jgi:hypothetical protein
MKLLAKIGLWGLMVGGTGSALHADPAGGWLSPNGVGGSNPTTTAPPVEPTGSARAGATAVISPADLQPRVHLLHEQMRADARHVQYLQQIARKEKDVIKLNCVNDKLVQIKPQMNMADSAESELGSSADATRMAAFDSVAQAAENVRRLREEADQCIGEAITQGGSESSNSFTGPQAPDDPSKGFGGNQLEPPGYASPFN